MKIMLYSNAPWAHSGYGFETNFMMRMLMKYNYDFSIYNICGLSNGILKQGNITLYGTRLEQFGRDNLPYIMKRSQSDIFLPIMDVFIIPDLIACKDWQSVPWVVSDHSPPCPEIVNAIKPVSGFIACKSKQLVKDLNEADITSLYIPPGINKDTYSIQSTSEARKKIGAFKVDDFVIGIIAANQLGNRKRIPEQLLAIRDFRNMLPEKEQKRIKIYLHTNLTANLNGMDLIRIIEQFGMNDMVIACNQDEYPDFFSDVFMSDIYNSLNVVSNASSEGFGLVPVQAAFCGIPMVTVNYAAAPDYTINHCNGYAVEPINYEILQNGIRHAYPNHIELISAYMAIYSGQLKWNRKEIRDHVVGMFEENYVFDHYWLPFLKSVETKMQILEKVA